MMKPHFKAFSSAITVICCTGCTYIHFDVSYVHCGFFKASDSGINVLSAPWFDMCTVWFVASLSCINMTLKS